MIAAHDAVTLAERAEQLREHHWEQFVDARTAAGRSPAIPRADAAVTRLLNSLITESVVTTEIAQRVVDTSPAAISRTILELEAAEILNPVKNHTGRVVAWSADGYLNLVTYAAASRLGSVNTRLRRPKNAPPLPTHPSLRGTRGRNE